MAQTTPDDWARATAKLQRMTKIELVIEGNNDWRCRFTLVNDKGEPVQTINATRGTYRLSDDAGLRAAQDDLATFRAGMAHAFAAVREEM